MPIIGGESFFGLLETYRVLTFDGRYGGGKSALSFYCAHHLLSTGRFRYLLSNCRSVWTDSPNDVVLRPDESGDPLLLDAVIVLDEAGLFLQYSEDSKKFMAFLRKGNVVLLCPSVEEVARNLRSVTVQRILNLQIVGLPAWVYAYSVKRGFQRDKSYFIWWMPSEIYGIYDSSATPVDDAGIGDLLGDWKDILAERERGKQDREGISYGRRRRKEGRSSPVIEAIPGGSTEWISPMEGGGREIRREVDRLEDLLQAVTDEVDRNEAISQQRKKGRR